MLVTFAMNITFKKYWCERFFIFLSSQIWYFITSKIKWFFDDSIKSSNNKVPPKMSKHWKGLAAMAMKKKLSHLLSVIKYNRECVAFSSRFHNWRHQDMNYGIVHMCMVLNHMKFHVRMQLLTFFRVDRWKRFNK